MNSSNPSILLTTILSKITTDPISEDVLKETLTHFPGTVIHYESARIVATQRDIARHLGVADSSIRYLVLEKKVRKYDTRWIDVMDTLKFIAIPKN